MGLDSVVNASTGGWQTIVARVAPAAITSLRHANISRNTPLGRTSLRWAYQDAKFTMSLSVPVGATAEVHHPIALPDGNVRSIEERGGIVWRASALVDFDDTPKQVVAGIQHVAVHEQAIVTTVSSGDYVFEAHYVPKVALLVV